MKNNFNFRSVIVKNNWEFLTYSIGDEKLEFGIPLLAYILWPNKKISKKTISWRKHIGSYNEMGRTTHFDRFEAGIIINYKGLPFWVPLEKVCGVDIIKKLGRPNL